ncbi:MAG: hypothetical protein U9N86_07820 [Bacteroidota bacterium]|nr:hypothetical protein [Bacteroidota bacterium]
MNEDKQASLEDKDLRKNLEDSFNQIGGKIETPDDLADEVFQTIDYFSLVGDVMDLFTVKFFESESQLIELFSQGDDPDV